MLRHVSMSIPLWLAMGCPEPSKSDTGSVLPSDTGQDVPTLPEGCILVDGAGGYATIADALTVAETGAEISLCAGVYEEEVHIDKSVHLTGPNDDEAIISAPTNTMAITITADGVTVSDVSVQSTRSGIVIEEANGVTLSGILFDGVDNYGVRGSSATALRIVDSDFLDVTWGGVRFEGGSGSVEGSSFTEIGGFAVYANGAAEIEVRTNVVTGIVPKSDSANDGHGIWLEDGAVATLSDNVITDVTRFGVYGDQSDADLNGDIIEGGVYGIIVNPGQLTAVGVTVTDATVSGIIAASPDSVTIEGCTISGDPSVVTDVAAEDWSLYESTGIYAGTNGEITIRDTTITGYNNAGIVLLPYNEGSDPNMVLDGVTLQDNGRIGLYMNSVAGELTDVNITGVIEVEDAGEEQCLDVGRNAAASLIRSNITWTGGSVLSNDGYGVAALYGVLDLSEVTMSGNSCAGIMNYGGAANVAENTFSQPGSAAFAASVVSYEGSSITISQNSFTDGQTMEEYYTSEYTSGEDTYRYVYYLTTGSDIQAWYGGVNTITGNTFVSGSQGIFLYESGGEIKENSWADYDSFALQASTNTDTVTFSDNTMTGSAGTGVYAISADVTVENFTVSDGVEDQGFFERYINDEFDSTGPYGGAGPAVYGSSSALLVRGLNVQNVMDNVVSGNGGTFEIIDLYADGIGLGNSYTSALYFWFYSTDGEVWLNDVELRGVGTYAAIQAYAYRDSTTGEVYAQGTLHADGVSVTETREHGFYLQNVTADLTDSTVYGASGSGIYADHTTLSVSGGSFSANTNDGIYTVDGPVVVTGTEITGNTGSGLAGFRASIELTGSTIDENGGSGVALEQADATVTDNLISGNRMYGMVCTEVAFKACGNTIEDNVMGPQGRCHPDCEIPLD